MLGQQAPVQPSPLDVRFHKLEVNYRWALAVAVIALIALVAVVGWFAISQATQPKGEAAFANLTASWSGDDASAFEQVYAEDAVFVSAGSVEYKGLAAIKGVFGTMKSYGFQAEVIGPVVQSGSTVVSPIHLTWSTGEQAWVTTILELDGQGLVVHHQDYGQP
jgi:hypothetical protein